ncbi:MAG: endonuclease Q family protein [Bacillota bacterium]|jgi:uncharacterized protein (TIGR00375 family)
MSERGLNRYFVDLHVHIGRDSAGKPVKVSGARNLTFANIAKEAATRKGIDIVAVVDCASTRVLKDIEALLESGDMTEAPGGGFRYLDKTTVIPGAEVESACPGSARGAHYLSLFPTLTALRQYSRSLSRYVSNMDLSTQRARLSPVELAQLAADSGGLFLVAHAFTPHKSLYGTCAHRMSEVFGEDVRKLVDGVELGLSADTDMADRIGELSHYTFTSNSDAHSLPKIGREYNVMRMKAPSFSEVRLALARLDGRRVVANYGLDPRLGKYHLTACEECGHRFKALPNSCACPVCGSVRTVRGVADRIDELSDTAEPIHPPHRPSYNYQIPLEFVPGLGPARIGALIDAFGTEMTVIHETIESDIAEVVGEEIAHRICLAREGRLGIQSGGGGAYGKAVVE